MRKDVFWNGYALLDELPDGRTVGNMTFYSDIVRAKQLELGCDKCNVVVEVNPSARGFRLAQYVINQEAAEARRKRHQLIHQAVLDSIQEINNAVIEDT